MASPPGLRPEEAFHRENLLRVLIPKCRDGHNSLCFQASGSDSFAGLPAPLKTTTSFRTQSATTLPSLVSIFILRCDRDGHVRLLSKMARRSGPEPRGRISNRARPSERRPVGASSTTYRATQHIQLHDELDRGPSQVT